MFEQTLTAVALATALVAFARPAPAADAAHPPAALAHLALVADPHISSEPKYASYVQHFHEVIAEVNAADVDGVLLAGDLAQSGNPKSLQYFKELAQGFLAPCWYIAGNHDAGNKVMPDKPAEVSERRMADFVRIVGPAYYDTTIKPGVRLIGISTALFGSGLPLEEAQWKFLKTALSSTTSSTTSSTSSSTAPGDPPRFTLILTHYPAFVETPDEAVGYFNMEMASRQRYLDLLTHYPGGHLFVLTGHLHRPILTDYHGIPDVGAPAVSFGLPKGKQAEGWVMLTLLENGHLLAQIHYLNDAGTGPAATAQPVHDLAPAPAPAALTRTGAP